MGIRETLNQNPGLTTGATAAIIVIALGLIIWQATGGSDSSPSVPTKAFYSDDDGKTYFADDVNKVPPYDHNGKPAVRAHVFQCGGGKTKFVGYLERFSPDVKARIDKAKANPASTGAIMEDAAIGGMEYKKPGTGTWVRQMTPQAAAVVKVACPDGNSDSLEPLNP